MIRERRWIAGTAMFTAAVVGRGSLLLFVLFLFIGSLNIIRITPTGIGALAWDGLLSGLFFLQHSGMMRRGFRAFLSRVIPPYYLEATFAIVSGVILTLVVLLWQTAPPVWLELGGFWRWVARGVFVAAVAGIGWGVQSLPSFDPYGWTVLKDHLNGTSPQPPAFAAKGPYLWMRHPLYFFVLLMIWSCPVLSTDRLLFNVMWTCWIYLGTVLEEKDLLSAFGDQYRTYQKQVSMLIPWKRLFNERRHE